jgi:hypothetical protein
MPTENEPQIVTEQEAIAISKAEHAEAKDPLDLHAQLFYLYAPIFKKYLNVLNKKALIRLIGSLIEVPLNEKEIKLRSKVEQDCFKIGEQLLSSKFVMMILTEAQYKMKEAEEKTTELPIVVDKPTE